jgi:hypothetical protein
MLEQGMRGDAVAALQQHLRALGYDLGPAGVDGVFGYHTEQAVRQFQQQHGLRVDGVVGPRTSAALTVALAQAAGELVGPPQGLAQIRAVFGDIQLKMGPNPNEACYLRIEGAWAAHSLVTMEVADIPAIQRIYCHHRIVPVLREVFAEIAVSGLADEIHSFDGCFCPRYKRRTVRALPSVHCWGIALDLNAATNRQGTTGDMSRSLVALFRSHGFKWGGDWKGRYRDPMHFQYCTGY